MAWPDIGLMASFNEQLVEFHLRTHDPTTPDRQGPDRGSRESHA